MDASLLYCLPICNSQFSMAPATLPSPLSPADTSPKLIERSAQFIRACRSSDVVAHDTPKSLRFHRRHMAKQILDQRPPYRHEGVSIVKAERRQLVTLPADVQRFSQGKLASAGGLPQLVCRLVPVGCGLVQRVLFLAQTGVDDHHCLSRPILQPTLRHLDLAAALRRRFALILFNVETPSPLRYPRPVLANNGSATKRC